MCSTRKMSLSVGAVICASPGSGVLPVLPPYWVGPSSMRRAPSRLGLQSAGAAQPGEVGVKDHRDEDGRTQDDLELVRADAAQVEPVLQFAEHQHAQPH